MEVMSFQQTEFKLNGRFSPDDFSKDFENKLKMSDEEEEELIVDDDDYEEDDDEDFSFACVNPDGSADDVIQNGEIRPIFPVFGRDISGLIFAGEDSESLVPPLKKLFIEERSPATAATEEPAGPFCEWGGKIVREASPDRCRKSNSTGFSKLRRIRELVLKSNSDGKDAFVFLNDAGTASAMAAASESKKQSEIEKGKVKKSNKKKTEETTPLTAYMKSKVKENDKRKAYLPYKQVGFFTNVNGLTRNVHPF